MTHKKYTKVMKHEKNVPMQYSTIYLIVPALCYSPSMRQNAPHLNKLVSTLYLLIRTTGARTPLIQIQVVETGHVCKCR